QPPPDDVLSDDGRAYLRWTLARDGRGCSEVTVLQRESPLVEALPRLLARGSDAEVLRRVRAAARPAPESTITAFARLWLSRTLEQTTSRAVQAAIGLAGIGDAHGADVLRAALDRGERVPEVTAALVHLDFPVAPAGRAAMPARTVTGGEGRGTEALVRLLRQGERQARLDAAAT